MGWSKSTRITIMLGIDVAFLILELSVGLAVGSLALMADAFHMLNDIISLAVGLWAVKAAQRPSTDKFSFGFSRAELLGAFFNAVFLIALCVTIILDAIPRLVNPPNISNPKLILIVGSLGLTSNLVGFLVLGGHGHSHGPGEGHDHSHSDEHSAAEEGHAHAHEADDHSHDNHEHTHAGESYVDVVKANTKSSKIRFTGGNEGASTSKDSNSMYNKSPSKKHRRRPSGRFTSIDDIIIHPASFRQEIIEASRSPEASESESNESDGAAAEDQEETTEASTLIAGSNGNSNGTMDHDDPQKHNHPHKHNDSHSRRPRRGSLHAHHNHKKPKKASKTGHSHTDMGMNAMILHVIGDALGNVGVVISAVVIGWTTWKYRFYADPIVSVFITLIILKSTIPLTLAAMKILLQATPEHIDVNEVKEDIQDIPGVISCHHVHIWQLSDTQIVASMHVQIAFPISEAGGEKYMDLARAARKCLHEFGIHSATIQPEFCTDDSHDHLEGVQLGFDGIVGQPRCRMDDDCLLECIDNCKSQGCCGPSAETQRDQSDHDGRSH